MDFLYFWGFLFYKNDWFWEYKYINVEFSDIFFLVVFKNVFFEEKEYIVFVFLGKGEIEDVEI